MYIFYLGDGKVGSHYPGYEGRKVAEKRVGESWVMKGRTLNFREYEGELGQSPIAGERIIGGLLSINNVHG